MVDGLFSALADPTRRRVVELLGRGPHRAGALSREAGVSPGAMSRHLRVLLEAGLVRDERPPEDARTRVFHLEPASVVALQTWLDDLKRSWDGQLAAYKHHVERSDPS